MKKHIFLNHIFLKILFIITTIKFILSKEMLYEIRCEYSDWKRYTGILVRLKLIPSYLIKGIYLRARLSNRSYFNFIEEKIFYKYESTSINNYFIKNIAFFYSIKANKVFRILKTNKLDYTFKNHLLFLIADTRENRLAFPFGDLLRNKILYFYYNHRDFWEKIKHKRDLESYLEWALKNNHFYRK